MIENLPPYLNMAFLLTVAATLSLYGWANRGAAFLLVIVVAWGVVQSLAAYFGFYASDAIRFALVLAPVSIAMIYGSTGTRLQKAIARRDRQRSTFLHSVRISMELILAGLYSAGVIPELMTYHGRNFDILAGLTAPIIGVLFLRRSIGKRVMIGWNVIALGLILFILVNALLSTEAPFQQFAFDQPNRAVMYFPFILLPSVVVPLVIYTHIVDLLAWRQT